MKLAAAGLMVLLMAACAAGPTPYQPRPGDDEPGYSDQALESDRVRIIFQGNYVTPRETVENYLLYRAAEVTLERGYRFFVPTVQDVEREEQRTTVATGFGTGFGGGWWNGGFFGSNIVIIDTLPANGRESYRASAVFKLLGEEPQGPAMDAFDAQEVIEALGPSIIRPPAAQAGT